jgi:predicted nucleic acid-binding protein
VVSAAYHLLGERGRPALNALLSRRAVVARFNLDDNVEAVGAFLQKYANVPMSFADACLVRMSETMADPLILTTDSDFQRLSPS